MEGLIATWGYFPDPNAESGESARAVVAAAKKEIRSSSPIRDYYSLLYTYLLVSHVQIMK